MRRLQTVASVVAALGCASGPTNTVTPGYEGAPGVERFLVCAPNTLIALPAELQNVTGALREQIDAYLKFQGRKAEWINLYDSKQLWSEALSDAKAQGAVEKTPVFFAERARQRYAFDAIVMPSLLLHQTRAADSYAEWDGVSRHMQVVNAPKMPSARAQSTLAEGIAYGGISGDVMVTSVHVLVYSRAGERIFEGRGGIGFVHDIDMSLLKKKNSWQFQMRELARDIDALREGIAIAFDPYLTPPEE
jgi:hypothetical protein